jgi:hypothetical protein
MQRDPKKAVVCILTDGQENASREFTKEQVKKMLEKCEKKDWLVLYLSADVNAFSDAESMGISGNRTMSFTSNAKGANVAPMAMSYATSDYRRMGRMGFNSSGGMAVYGCRASSNYDSSHDIGLDHMMSRNATKGKHKSSTK